MGVFVLLYKSDRDHALFLSRFSSRPATKILKLYSFAEPDSCV